MPFDHHPRVVVVVASGPLDARIREAWGRDNGVLLGSIAPPAVPAPSAVPWDLAIVEYALGDAHRPSSHFCILRDAKPKAPIITVSDAPLEEAIVEALRAGAVDHVSDTRLTTIRAIAERALCAEQGSAPEREPVAQPQHWPPDIRALMQAGIANSPEAILVADREGRVVLANPAAQRLFACPIPLGEGYAALARLGFHHPDGSPVATRDLPLIRAALDGETIHEILLAIPRPDGRTGDLLINASPIYTTDGTLDGGVGVFIDITERKAAETALQRQRAVLAGINRILAEAITCETEEQLGETCLLVALDLTASRAGFVGEIGTGRLPHGLTNTHMGWAHCTMGDGQTASHHPPGGAALHGLYGRVIEAGQSLLANDMPADLDDIGVPSGHPSLASFLGVPLRHAGEIIGVLVVANREGGYTREQQEDLEALAPAVVEALYRKRVELAMRASERRLALDLARMTRLQALSTRLVQPDDLMTLLQEILAAAAETTGTDKGNIQFVDDDTGGLRIVVHQGLSARFLQHFAEDGCAATCGAAQRGRQRVILEDLRQEPTLRNTQDLLISEAEGIRAVVSTPLITRNGHLLGVLSNHYGAPYQPPKHELRYIDLLARMAADVIERSRTEQALRASETRFRELADAMPQLVWTARPDGVVDYSNQRYVEFAGIRPMPQNAASSGERWEWESVVHPDDARATAEAWRHAVSTGEPFEIEHHLARGDGSYRWYLSRGVPARDAAGNITRWYCTATDIHANKEAETLLEKAVASRTAALAESEARFRAVFEDAALGIAALDLEGRVLAANPALERLLGRSKDALLGHLLADYGAPGIDREALHERYRELVRGDASTSRGETRFRELADAMPQLVWTARPDGVVDYYNQRYVEFAGIRPMSQNPGSSGERWEWESVVHPDDARATVEAWRRAVVTGEPFEIEHRVRRADGVYRWYLSRGVPVRDATGNITRWYGTATDIHATKEAETLLEEAVATRTAALAESEARFRAVFEDAALGIAALDLEGRVLAANPALEQLLGRPRDELLGRPLADYCAPGIDREALHERYRALVGGDASTSRSETRWLRADGRARLGQLTTSVVRDTSGAPRFAICMIDDITEERQARAALIQAERLNVTGQLTAAFAHEIKNPLQAVIGCLGLLAEVLTEEGAISDEAQRYLQVARSELHRADRVVNRLREFHRRGNDTPAPTSLVDVVEQVLLVTQKQCEQRFVTARLDVAHEPPLVEARQDELRQVFLNLVFNAIDAMPEGGLLRVAVESTDDPPGVRVAVADSGHGIAAEALPHVFEFLYTTKEQGTGLGLFVCDEIVRHHGGEIAVESVEGAGTTFTVWLPA